mmetsp:Transcript_15065/g.17442  ORF Transcript_15065/g.17442 Transcript_15065/m.17442 type:complete len:85 (-) Transcript_15065:473-727(-)
MYQVDSFTSRSWLFTVMFTVLICSQMFMQTVLCDHSRLDIFGLLIAKAFYFKIGLAVFNLQDTLSNDELILSVICYGAGMLTLA